MGRVRASRRSGRRVSALTGCGRRMSETLLIALPLHPALVHFPVALFSLTWFFVLVGHATGRESRATLVTPLEWIALAFVPPTILTGIADAGGLGFLLEPAWGEPLIWHFLLSTGAAGAFAVHAVWRRQAVARGTVSAWRDVGLTTVGFSLLLMTGLIAGEMVFG